MTKAELIKALEPWKDNANIEVELKGKDADYTWFEIKEVEDLNENEQKTLNAEEQHCIIRLGKVTGDGGYIDNV